MLEKSEEWNKMSTTCKCPFFGSITYSHYSYYFALIWIKEIIDKQWFSQCFTYICKTKTKTKKKKTSKTKILRFNLPKAICNLFSLVFFPPFTCNTLFGIITSIILGLSCFDPILILHHDVRFHNLIRRVILNKIPQKSKVT